VSEDDTMTAFEHRRDDLDEAPVYVISVVAQITGLHAQTLRQYDRVGLVSPRRTAGGGRRYSRHDIERLRQIQLLSQEGIGLVGIRQILDLQAEVVRLVELANDLRVELEAVRSVVEEVAHRSGARPNRLLPVLRPRATDMMTWNPTNFEWPS
jgi:MerR family transcriptional regulator, heat shock protein HspR